MPRKRISVPPSRDWSSTQILPSAAPHRYADSTIDRPGPREIRAVSARNDVCTTTGVPAPAPQRGDVVRIRDERWTVAESSPHRHTTVLTVVGCDRANGGCRARYLLPFEPIERLPSVDTSRVVSRRRWQHLARGVLARAVPSMDSLRAAATADIAILPYQLEPALALVSGAAARILIADDVGLGKTIQAGLIVSETLARHHDAHVLIVCPAGLRTQWQDELIRRFHVHPVILDSTSLQRLPLLDGINPWAAHPLILASTDYIKRPEVVRAFEPLVWDLLVVDEAHSIAGNSDRHAAVTLLAHRARELVLLTATPHSGDDIAFNRLIAAGNLEAAFPLLAFRRTRADTASQSPRRTRWLRIRPTTAERRLHRALRDYVSRVWRRPASSAARLAMIVLTRRACSHALSLARTVERRIALLADDEAGGDQLQLPLLPFEAGDDEPDAEVGGPGLHDTHDERRRLEAILALARQAAESPSKLRALWRLLRRSREPAIVFTEYRDTLAALEHELGAFGTCQLHGGLTTTERTAAIHAFTSGRSRVLLATDAASEGLNLQRRCRLVVHLELPWTPTRIEQRVGRVDRIGQTRTVHQLHLLAAGTIEESRVRVVVERMSRVASTLQSLSRPHPDERQVAAFVLGNERLPSTAALALPAGVITADFRALAEREAARLSEIRRLHRNIGTGDTELRSRPFVSTGRHLPAASGWWALWLECVDAEGQLVWDTLVGASGSHQSTRAGSAADLREFVERTWKQVRDHVSRDEHSLAGLARWLRTSVKVPLEREQAIARAIQEHHARMASRLLQGSLFDRQAEREATAQRELLRQALSRCRSRIEELHRRRTAAVITTRPAFSLFTW